MKKKLVLILFAFVFSLGAKSEKLLLTLDKAQTYALEHSRTLQNASYDVKKAEAVKWQAISGMLPQVKASYDYSDKCGYTMDMEGMKIDFPTSGTFTLEASATLSGAQIIGATVGNLSRNMQKISYSKSEQTVLSDVEKTYMSILALNETLALLDSSYYNLNDLYNKTKISVKVGAAEKTDADQLSVQVATLKTDINSTKRNLEILKNTLLLQIGAPSDSEVEITENIEKMFNAKVMLGLLSNGFVMENNYDYKLLKSSTLLSKKQLAANYMNYLPTVTGFYQYSKIDYYGSESSFNMTPPNLVGVSVSMPLFTSFSNANKVKEARFEYRKTKNTFEDTKIRLEIQNKQLRYNLSSAYEKYETERKNMQVTAEVFHNISRKFELGAASSIDVTTANTNLINVQNSYVQAMLEMINAQIALEDLLNK